jgi:hypothetical protein
MRSVNRTLVFIRPRNPYADWANSVDDAGPRYILDEHPGTAYLLPDNLDMEELNQFVRDNYRALFEDELDSWCSDPSRWPEDRSQKRFQEWFEVGVADLVYDLDPEDLETEEL